MSYAGLVLDRDRARGGEELLDEVVLLGVERRAAEEVHPERAVERLAGVGLVLPGLRARLDDTVGDHVGRLLERELLPFGRVRRAVLHLRLAHGRVHELLARGALRAQAPA